MSERLVFDWRALQFYAPIEDDLNTVVNLSHHPELYPELYGVRCKFTSGVELVLLENKSNTNVTWFFPYTNNLWQPASKVDLIYSMTDSPLGTFPEGCAESLTLSYPGKCWILLP